MSGMLRVVAPALMTASRILYRKAGSERPASSGLNSMSSQPRLLRYFTAFTAFSTTCTRPGSILCKAGSLCCVPGRSFVTLVSQSIEKKKMD